MVLLMGRQPKTAPCMLEIQIAEKLFPFIKLLIFQGVCEIVLILFVFSSSTGLFRYSMRDYDQQRLILLLLKRNGGVQTIQVHLICMQGGLALQFCFQQH